MCEYCLKHGDGEKWYLEAKNYSEDLLSDARRQHAVTHFVSNKNVHQTRRELRQLELLERTPGFIKRVVGSAYALNYRRDHSGQVVPIEDVERIFGFVNSVARLPCFCRYTLHKSETRFCYGIALGPNGGRMLEILEGVDDSFFRGPDMNGIEQVSREEALAQMRELERHGACHTIWTFRSPFIGGICNCDRSDCLAMITTLNHGIKLFWRGEYVVQIDPARCKGCRQCMRVCQFGAVVYAAATKKAAIDPRRCYGCGICRAMCKQGSIRLIDRRDEPTVANLWW